MKKLLITALFMVAVTTFAQQGRQRMTPEKRVEAMTAKLNLDAKQQEQVKQIYVEQAKNRENQTDYSREQMREDRKKTDEKLKTILTPEQLKKWEESQAEMRQRMQQGQGMGDKPAEGNSNN